mmetsp:Transcript_1896/g.4451  ORF Transcript_1896/g.4451 Transcript_1896/m.4451 type:complete len:223 (+) Transcript_1896:250-918(+)
MELLLVHLRGLELVGQVFFVGFLRRLYQLAVGLGRNLDVDRLYRLRALARGIAHEALVRFLRVFLVLLCHRHLHGEVANERIEHGYDRRGLLALLRVRTPGLGNWPWRLPATATMAAPKGTLLNERRSCGLWCGRFSPSLCGLVLWRLCVHRWVVKLVEAILRVLQQLLGLRALGHELGELGVLTLPLYRCVLHEPVKLGDARLQRLDLLGERGDGLSLVLD